MTSFASRPTVSSPEPTPDGSPAVPLGRVVPPGNGSEPTTNHTDPLKRPVPAVHIRIGRWLQKVVKRVAAYLVLAVMAGADAFFFYNTLAGILQRGVEYLWIFVLALSLGAVLACEFAGRLTRRRQAGHGGSIAWIGVLVTLWLSLGALLTWIRAQTALTEESGEEGALAAGGDGSSAGGADVDWWLQPQVQVAALMLLLYLLTGVLTMTFGYLVHDPRTERERELVALKEDLAWAAIKSDARRQLERIAQADRQE